MFKRIHTQHGDISGILLRAPWIREGLYMYNAELRVCGCVCVCNGVMCSHTRHQTSLWTRHLLATLETSSGPAAGPSLLFGSNPSHKYLWSCQNLRRKMKKEVGEATKHRSLCVGEEATQKPIRSFASSLPLSIYIKTPLPQALTENPNTYFSRPGGVGSAPSDRGRLTASH